PSFSCTATVPYNIYTLSLHDALPISLNQIATTGTGRLLTQLAIVLPEQVATHLGEQIESESLEDLKGHGRLRRDLVWTLEKLARSEEHTSELQSRFDLVCRLLLEKKK